MVIKKWRRGGGIVVSLEPAELWVVICQPVCWRSQVMRCVEACYLTWVFQLQSELRFCGRLVFLFFRVGKLVLGSQAPLLSA